MKFRRANFPDAVDFRSTTRKAETLKVHFEYSCQYSYTAPFPGLWNACRLFEDNTATFPEHVTTHKT